MEEVELGEIVIDEEFELGEIEVDVIKIYPELENLVVTPTAEEQIFTSTKYGFENVTVKAVETEELNIIPSTVTQVKEGIFNKVTVAGDSNLLAENIKQGTSIFGVEGTAKTTNAKITDASYLFYYGARIDNIDELLGLCENVISMKRMFNSCTTLKELNLSNFDTSNVTDMSDMFCYCSSLTEIDLSNFDTSNVTNMSDMFNSCSSLTEIDLSNFDTSNVTDMSNMFISCSGLTSLDLSNFDASKVKYIDTIFYNCRELTNLRSFKNLGKGYINKSNNYSFYKLNLSNCTKLTHESLMDVINNLYDLNLTYDVANGGTLYTQSLVLGSTNLAKLTSEEIAIATAKGWTVS